MYPSSGLLLITEVRIEARSVTSIYVHWLSQTCMKRLMSAAWRLINISQSQFSHFKNGDTNRPHRTTLTKIMHVNYLWRLTEILPINLAHSILFYGIVMNTWLKSADIISGASSGISNRPSVWGQDPPLPLSHLWVAMASGTFYMWNDSPGVKHAKSSLQGEHPQISWPILFNKTLLKIILIN